MYDKIRDRYLRYYITDVQLDRYVALGVVTQEQADALRAERAVSAQEVIPNE